MRTSELVTIALIVAGALIGYYLGHRGGDEVTSSRHEVREKQPVQTPIADGRVRAKAETELQPPIDPVDEAPPDDTSGIPPMGPSSDLEVLALDTGDLFDLSELREEDRKVLESHAALQSSLAGFDPDQVAWVRGVDDDVGALVVRDRTTKRQVPLDTISQEELEELVDLRADLQAFRASARQRFVDRASVVFETRDAALAYQKERSGYEGHVPRTGRGGYVLIPRKCVVHDPDVVHCRREIQRLQEQLGVHVDSYWRDLR